MEQKFRHSIKYTNEQQFTLAEIADSLLAQDKLVRYLPKIISDAIPGLTVDGVKISLIDAETGSLKEEFLVSLFLAFQDDLQSEVTDLVEGLTGMAVPEKYDTIVTLIVILVVLYGAKFVYSKFRGDRENPASINGDYNNVLNITADTLNISSDALDSAVRGAVHQQPQRDIIDAATRFFRPAKKGGGAPVIAGGQEISLGAVKEFPSEASMAVDSDTPIEPYPDVRIQILALDRQKRRVGWAGRFVDKEILAERLRMDLYPTVDLAPLSKAEVIRADVMVEFKEDKDGNLVPSRIHVVKVHAVEI